MALYDVSKENAISVESLRYKNFVRYVTKTKFNLAALPEMSKIGLTPIKTTKDPAPEALLKSISSKWVQEVLSSLRM